MARATSETRTNARPSGIRASMRGTVYGRTASGARWRSLARNSPRVFVIDDPADRLAEGPLVHRRRVSSSVGPSVRWWDGRLRRALLSARRAGGRRHARDRGGRTAERRNRSLASRRPPHWRDPNRRNPAPPGKSHQWEASYSERRRGCVRRMQQRRGRCCQPGRCCSSHAKRAMKGVARATAAFGRERKPGRWASCSG